MMDLALFQKLVGVRCIIILKMSEGIISARPRHTVSKARCRQIQHKSI
jgi:hypothetical protein